MDMRTLINITAASLSESIDLSGDFYHGTARNNLAFHDDHVAYFTPSYEVAKTFAIEDSYVDAGVARVIKVRLAAKNPVVLSHREMQDLHMFPDRVKALRDRGHDVAIGSTDEELCVLDPRIIIFQKATQLEGLELPEIEIGDEVMVGKFKNRKATVQGFDTDDHNQPVLKTDKGPQKLFKPRISKLDKRR